MAPMTKTKPVYTAICERDHDSGVWVVTVAEIDGIVTQAKNLVEARKMATDAIALWQETKPNSFEVAIEARVARDADRLSTQAGRARAEAEAAQAAASERMQEAVRSLIQDQGLTVRDAAEILGISYQRVAQLAPARRKAGARR